MPPGFRVVIIDRERYWVAQSQPMTLREAVEEAANWEIPNDSQVVIVPPDRDQPAASAGS